MAPPPPSLKKRRLEEAMHGGKVSRPKKRIRKQLDYHSSESDDDHDLDHSNIHDSNGDDGDVDATISDRSKPKSKRNNPSAFATSISRILSTKLPAAGRADPVLARSRNTTHPGEAADEDEDRRLEKKVRAAEKRERQERQQDTARVVEAGATAEEKRLRKTAQRGVVRLFNAVRAAQVRAAEQASKDRQGAAPVVGMEKREARAREMSRDAFLQKMMV
ncbi:hypothetical protein DV736_g2932, partial [Chaetothyriales sp. CBS 134916]